MPRATISRITSPIDWRVIPARTAMSAACEPSSASVAKTELWAGLSSRCPRRCAACTMSACSARLARSTSAISGLRSGLGNSPLDIRKDSFQYFDRSPYSIRGTMDTKEQTRMVAALFTRARHRTTRVAVEQEFITTDLTTGAPPAIDRVRRAAAVADQPAAAALAGRYLGFEPGGQVELSLPCTSG